MSILVLLALAGPACAQESSPLELRLSWSARKAQTSWTGKVGDLPSLSVEQVNPSTHSVDGQISYGWMYGQWPLGPGARLRVSGPDGEQLYHPPRLRTGLRPLTIEPRSSHITTFPLASFLALAREGRYTVTLELQDAKGRAIPPASLSLELTSPKTASRVSVRIVSCRDEPGGVVARLRFSNEGPATAAVMKPQDGSIYMECEPRYWFVVRDSAGRIVQHLGQQKCRVPPWIGRDEAYMVLGPGQSRELELRPPVMLHGGRYTVVFHYLMSARPVVKGVEPSPQYRQLVLGRLSSAPLTIDRAGVPLASWADLDPDRAVPRLLKVLTTKSTWYSRHSVSELLYDLMDEGRLSPESRRSVRRVLKPR